MEPLFNKVEGFRPATLFKRNSSTGVFLWILWNFSAHLFYRILWTTTFASGEVQTLNQLYYSSKHIFLEEQLVDSSHGIILFYLSVCFNIQNLNLCSAVALTSPNLFTMEIKDWRSLTSAPSTNNRASAEHLMNGN